MYMTAAATEQTASYSELSFVQMTMHHLMRSKRGWGMGFTSAVVFAMLGPGLLYAAKPAPKSKPTTQTVETLLSGSGWKLGSFPMGDGEAKGAMKPDFDDTVFRTVQVPGEVQLQNGLKGRDLFVQSKELNLINNQEWWYRKAFKVPAGTSGKLVRLQFDGVDYFSTVWLNGEKLGEHEGDAEGFSFDASKQLKYGAENVLVVKVTCPWLPKGRGLTEYLKTSFSLQVTPLTPALASPPYFLGGGWGGVPVYANMSMTMGLYRDVRLLISEPVVLEDLFVYTKALNADGSATLEITGNARNYRDGQGEAQIGFDLTPSNFSGEPIHIESKTLSLQPGDNKFAQEATVRNPQLWWTWDLGPQNLYRLDAKVAAGAGAGGNSGSATFGIRTITRDEDLSYRLNGKRIFLKGVWYPMGDYYPSRNTHQTYERDLRLLKATYSNHLVTQIVEKQDLYDLCDQLGMVIFIQLPFTQFGPYQVVEAGNPRREPFLKNSREQVDGIVRALRNHPSIVQWSPLAEARMNGKWAGSQEGYDFFIAEMEKVIKPLTPGTIFHPSLCDLGESHTWNANYRFYQQFQPALISEYGEISPPSLETFKEALTPEQMWSTKNQPRIYNLPVDIQAYTYWTAWEYTDSGFGVFNMFREAHTYIDQDIRSAQELVDALQLQHAFTLSYATEAFRRKMHTPINGIRTWAFRDIYPGIQFGMVDSNGIPKMNYYFYKRAQPPLAVSFLYEAALESQVSGKRLQIPIWIANESGRTAQLEVKAEILTPAGEVIWSKSFEAETSSDASRQVGLVDWVTPEKPGVYVLRGSATEKNGNLANVNTTYIKVAPRAFAKSPRVLVIGWKRYGQPIASMIEALGANVDVIDENNLDRLAELKNAEVIRAQYDVVWLSPLDHFWKLVEPGIGEGLAEAVRQGVGFIHSGGDAAFHGGAAKGACLELTRLAEMLPVELRTQNEDTVYPAYSAGQELPATVGTIKDVKAVDPAWTDAGLNGYGVPGYNQTEAKAEGKVALTIEGRPLLVTGHYGQGRTVAFTGFTPSWEAPGGDFLDEQFDNMPVSRAYFGLFAQMLAAATGEKLAVPYSDVLAAREKPLFQMLKELPAAKVQSGATLQAKASGNGAKLSIDLTAGKEYARLIRLRAVWEGPQPYMSMYSDNYFDLMPGEAKSIALELQFPEKLSAPVHGRLILAGSNMAASEIPVTVNP
jgi:beta-mannosidase